MHKIIGVFSILFFSFSLSSQTKDWREMMHDPNANFYETVEAFDQWWGSRPYERGQGFKPFQRWKHYWSTRLNPDGTRRDKGETIREYLKYKEFRGQGLPAQNAGEAEWTEVGPVDLPSNGTGQPNGVGRVSALAFHPNDTDIIFVGAPAGGIRRSDDYGKTWVDLSANLPRLGVSGIVVHPTDYDTIYVATGDRDGGDAPGYGVWWTIDGGATWASRNTGMGDRTVYDIIMDATDSDILIASTADRIFRTLDGGATWTVEYSGSDDNKDLAFHPTDHNIVYASGQNFWRSTNNGNTWTKIGSGAGAPTSRQRIAIGTTKDDSSRVYLFAGQSGGFDGLYESTDEGATFTKNSSTPNICQWSVTGSGTGGQAWYDLVLIGDPDDADHIFASSINVWESFDAGSTWSIVSHWSGGGGHPAVHADHHAGEFSPHTGDLFDGHDGGLHYSEDDGASWIEISSGLANGQIYKIGQSTTDRSLTIAGFQDNGTAFTKRGSWATEIGGDGMECIIDHSDNDIMYGALYYGDMRRSTNGGSSFSQIAANGKNGIDETGAWVTPYTLHPDNSDTMVIGYDNVWMAYNVASGGTNSIDWEQISFFTGNSNMRDMAFAPSDPKVLYASRDRTGERFFRCDNIYAGSPTWVNLTDDLPTGSTPLDIAVDPDDTDILWIAVSNNIYKSEDAGETWTDVSVTLPNINLNCIVIDTSNALGGMYVGMDAGVYYRDDSLSDWEPFDQDIPLTEVTELEIYYDKDCVSQSALKAATYGRGVWETPLYFSGDEKPSVCFDASTTTPCRNQVITLTDQTAYLPTSWSWTITPATVTYENGTSSSSENPNVTFTAIDTYTVKLVAMNANGDDSLTATDYIMVTDTAVVLPLSEDFEATGTCGTSSDCETTDCTLDDPWLNLENEVEDDIDFRVDENGTPSGSTGPTVDYNPGTSTGNYIYTEASSCFGKKAFMESACLDLRSTSKPVISFAYHMYGIDMGSLHLDVFSNGSWTEDVHLIEGDQGNAWAKDTVDLSSYNGYIVKIRFRGITGGNYRSDITLDDISIYDELNCVVSNADDSGSGSLRQCIDDASDGTLVTFDPALDGQTISLTSEKLTLDQNTTISAVGQSITVSANSILQGLVITSGKTVSIDNLTIRAGTATDGRAIENNGTLTLKDVELLENTGMPVGGSLFWNKGEGKFQGTNKVE